MTKKKEPEPRRKVTSEPVIPPLPSGHSLQQAHQAIKEAGNTVKAEVDALYLKKHPPTTSPIIGTHHAQGITLEQQAIEEQDRAAAMEFPCTSSDAPEWVKARQSTEPYNDLTHEQAERLYLLVEELSETIQAASKALRHGYMRGWWHPDNFRNNKESLEMELGNVLAVLSLLDKNDEISLANIEIHKKKRFKTIFNFTHHQPQNRLAKDE